MSRRRGLIGAARAYLYEENAEFYKRKTGGTQSVGSGIAAIKEVRGKSIVWNQLYRAGYRYAGGDLTPFTTETINGVTFTAQADGSILANGTAEGNSWLILVYTGETNLNRKIFAAGCPEGGSTSTYCLSDGSVGAAASGDIGSGRIFTTTARNWGIRIQGGTTADNLVFRPKYIDLTLMFGAGNEPSSVAEFEKMFPLDYYDYNAGEVIPFAGQNLVTTGKNQYNPTSGKANLLGGQTYQLLGTYTGAEIDGVAVTLDSNDCFTTTNDCVLEITGGNDTDTFVSLYNGETNTFEPYEKHTLPLDPSQWRDKQSGNLVFPYGGMNGVNGVYDYAKVDADGYIRKAVRVFGAVDLGTLSWNYTSGSKFFYTTLKGMKVAANNALTNMISARYTPIIFNRFAQNNKVIATDIDVNNRLQVKDTSYNDISVFTAAMSNVMLIYELETPIEVELATPVYAKYLEDKDGTEEITPANGTTPYTTMANLSILYPLK